jgi:hypothetical protein
MRKKYRQTTDDRRRMDTCSDVTGMGGDIFPGDLTDLRKWGYGC